MRNKFKLKRPTVIPGGVAKDKKGKVSFVNGFGFDKVKRFYLVEVKKSGVIRAWHGHKREEKYAFLVSGKALLGVVKIDNFRNPSKKAKVYKFELSSESPCIVYIPPGYANGFKSLGNGTKLVFFSTSTLSESEDDDVRFKSDYWSI